MKRLATDTVKQAAQSFGQFLFTKICKKIKDKSAHNALYFQTAYEQYLLASKERNEKVKTLLYKQMPQDLYDFYECVGVRGKDGVVDTSDIRHLFALGNKLIITGSGGIGKTIMMKHLFLNCVQNTDHIPVLVELRGLNTVSDPDAIDIAEFIYANLQTFHFVLEREYFDYSLSLGKYVFIFDGFDEVKSNLAAKVAERILQLSDQYPENHYIVSSRPLDNGFVAWSDFAELNALGLTKEQALSLVGKLRYDKNIKDKFYAELDRRLYDKYQTFASNPLLLTIMLMTFAEGGEIPESFNDFYEQAYIALYKAHDASKGAYVRDKAAGLGINEFKRVFAHVCFQSFFASKYEFKDTEILELIERARAKCKEVKDFRAEDFLHDLTDSVCLLVRDGLHLRFAHRSFQEYFAAFHVTQLDDRTQEDVVKAWLSCKSFAESAFLRILQCMEPDRFDKNVLYPGLRALRKASEGLQGAETLRVYFDTLSVHSEKRFGLIVRDSYRSAIFDLVRDKRIKQVPTRKNKNKEKDMALYEALLERGLISDQIGYQQVPLQKMLTEEKLSEMLKEVFATILEIHDYGMQLLARADQAVAPDKRSLSALLKDL